MITAQCADTSTHDRDTTCTALLIEAGVALGGGQLPGRLCWKVLPPAKSLLLFDSSKLTLYFPFNIVSI